MKRLLMPALCVTVLIALGCGRFCATPDPPAGEDVSYAAGGDTVRAVLHRPLGAGPFPALVVLHGDFGLTDGVKEQALRLAEMGYITLAPDLYRGERPKELLDAHIMDRGVPEDRVQADLKAAVDYLTARPDVRKEAVGVIGWDSGGGYALDAAIHDSRLRAVVVCYGRLTTDPALLAPLQASVLGLFAGKDEGISPETIESFRRAMTKAGKRVVDLHVYPDCGPGFMSPQPSPNDVPGPPEAVADAWRRVAHYLDAELKR
jgi:carboxymethylenebutenolidase